MKRQKYNVLIFFIGLLAACDSGDQRLVGKWINLEDGRSVIAFKENNEVVYDQVARKNYTFIKEDVIEVTSTTTKATEQYEIRFLGDTLVLTGIESRQKYLPPSYFEREETIEKVVEQEARETTERMITGVDLTPYTFEELNQRMTINTALLKDIQPDTKIYVGDVGFTGDNTMQVTARVMYDEAQIPRIIWRETVESALKRNFKGRLRVIPTSIKLEKKRRNIFDGLVYLPDGDSMTIELDLRKSWMPTPDTAAMGTYTKYQMNAILGKTAIQNVDLSTEDKFHYQGEAYTAEGEKLEITTDRLKGWHLLNTADNAAIFGEFVFALRLGKKPEQITEVKKVEDGIFEMEVLLEGEEAPVTLFVDTEKLGWYPEDEIRTLETVVACQLIATTTGRLELQNVTLERINEGNYKGEAVFTEGVRKKLDVKHTGRGFTWEIVRPNAGKGKTS